MSITPKRLFITATGTDVGKTFVMQLLLQELLEAGKNVRALKPVITGVKFHEKNDVDKIIHIFNEHDIKVTHEVIARYQFEAPLSPDMAARLEGRQVDYPALLRFCEPQSEEVQLIEGAGGVMVPLDGQHTMRDLIADLAIPTIMVTETRLGTLSHTLAALEALSIKKIEIQAIILNESEGENHPPVDETIASLKNFTDTPMLVMPRGGKKGMARSVGLLCD